MGAIAGMARSYMGAIVDRIAGMARSNTVT
jgi:hypothetical protein